MGEPVNQVLQAIVDAARDATGAAGAWALSLRGDRLRAMAAAGERAGERVGADMPASSGTAGFVGSSGQPIALSPRRADPRLADGLASHLGRPPASVLCVPCVYDEAVVGALELVDKAGGSSFSFDDVELVTLLASVAGAALVTGAPTPAVRTPGELAAELADLSVSDPAGYARLATVLDALLGRG